MDKVSEDLKALAKLRADRFSVYGNAEFVKGTVMQSLFRYEPVTLKTADDFARYGVLDLMVSKLIRYANNFHGDGHDDSLDDISVYAQMLKNIHHEERSSEKC